MAIPRNKFVPDHRSFGAYIMTDGPGHPAQEAQRVAKAIQKGSSILAAKTINGNKAVEVVRGERSPWGTDVAPLALSYKVRKTVWVADRFQTPRTSYEVYTNDSSAVFNEFGGNNKKMRKPRRFMRRAAAVVAAQHKAGG